jgi:hypothetical protein
MNTSVLDSLFLETALKDLRDGKIQLPDFQRGWVWDDEHIRSLLASIASTYPVGAVMMLETGGEAKFQPRPVQGVEFKFGSPPVERLILDGQQRLTSLFQATMLGKVVVTKNAKKQEIRRWYYVDVARAGDAKGEMEDAIIGVPESRMVMRIGAAEPELDLSTAEKEYQAGMFPMRNVFSYMDWQSGYLEHWGYVPDKTKLFNAFATRFLMAFAKYQLPAIVLKKETPKVAVCQVFEKVNTGGVALNAFELLTATYAADNFSLRDDWLGPREKPGTGRKGSLAKDPVLTGVQETDLLQAVTLLHTYHRRQQDLDAGTGADQASAVSCKRTAILNLPLPAYRQWADPAMQGFKKAASIVRQQRIYFARDLPYQTQLVPLAAVLARLGKQADNDGVRRKLARWYWCGVFGELYGGAVESRFAFDLPEVLAWVAGGPEPRTVREALFDPGRLLTLRTRGSAAYKGVHALLMKDGGLDFLSGEEITFAVYEEASIDIHHVFPKAWCEDEGIPRQRYDSIVNKTAISARTNRIIGRKAPRSRSC